MSNSQVLSACKLVLGNKGRHCGIDVEKFKLLGVCDLDFDPMALVCKLYLDMVVICIQAKNEVNRSKGSKGIV